MLKQYFVLPRISSQKYQSIKKQAHLCVMARLGHFNSFYGFEYKRITIKRVKTLWGSCSTKQNLNFNYRIVFLPQELFDYIIVHELCHLKEHNHSKNFWTLVSQTIPNWKERRKQLRMYRL